MEGNKVEVKLVR